MLSLDKCLIPLATFLILSCMKCLHILEINSLLITPLANTFSHSVGPLFISFMVSFAGQRILSRSNRFSFVSFITLWGGFEKMLLLFMSESVQSMFSSTNFLVSSLTYRSLIHFEFIFVYRTYEHLVLENILTSFFCM